MKCPYCQHEEDRVLDSRTAREGEAIKRRRECLGCGRRFTTYETIEERRVMVVKKDGRREPFDRNKVLRGLEMACRKRPVSQDTLEAVVDSLERELYDRGQHEVEARVIGDMLVEELRQLDPVAFVRFASVYRDFQDLEEFQSLVQALRPAAKRRPAGGRKKDQPDSG